MTKKGFKIKKITIFTLLLISMTTMMSNVAIITALPRLQDYFKNIENIEFYSRLILTLPSLSIAFLSPFLGNFVFKFGKKNSALIALFLFAITGSAGLFLDHLEAFLLSRSMFGISVAILMIVSTSLVGDYFQGEQRHKFMGYQSAFMAIGGVTFVICGGFLSDINWRYPFGIYLIGFALIPMAYFFLIEKKEEDKEISDDSINISKNLFFVYILGFLYMLIFFILPTQIPFLIIDTFEASGKIAGSIISLAFFSTALGAISFSKLKKRFDFSTIYLIGLLIISIGFTGVGFINKITLFYFTSSILGFGGGIMMTNVTAWMLSKTTFEKRVKSSSYMTSSLFFGQFCSPIVFYPFISYFGVQDFFKIIGLSLILIIIVWIFYIKLAKNS